MSRVKELAEAHWQYIEGLLRVSEQSDCRIDFGAYIYKTAFEHGYKHAVEDRNIQAPVDKSRIQVFEKPLSVDEFSTLLREQRGTW